MPARGQVNRSSQGHSGHKRACSTAYCLPALPHAGKKAIVTGGNSGIGVETVRALAAAGAKVVLCARNVEQGQAVADEIKWASPPGAAAAGRACRLPRPRRFAHRAPLRSQAARRRQGRGGGARA
jgi:NAD(P)-dependent dehydrogenase (short-subunit alcohol dehydrogenase family)